MGRHKNFGDYSKEEIEEIKARVCVKHKCPYLASYNNCNAYNGKQTVAYKVCNYILYTGKSRGCMPDDCKHYLDKNVKKRKFGIPSDRDFD